MNIDTFLEIGSQHKICEDYIISGNDPFPFIIISDGCSSSDNTEMGARILCHLAKQYLKYRPLFPVDYHKMGAWIIHNAELVIRQLGLKLPCLDATLIVSYEYEDMIYIYFYGDGCLVTKNPQGIIIKHIEYSKNAPYYLSYQIDEKSNELYNTLNIEKKIITEFEDRTNSKMTVPFDGITYFVISNEMDMILLASDGLQSFMQQTSNKIERFTPMDIITPCINFKNTNGNFLKRRLNKQMKTFARENIYHFDDLSIGVFLKEK